MKILVIHATAGAGHTKAAEALYNGLKKTSDHQVVYIDALDRAVPFFKRFYSGIYFFLISKLPNLWGFCFEVIDQPWLQGSVRCMRRAYNRIMVGRLHTYLCAQQFDYILTTHFLPTEVAAALKRKGKIKSKIITVITDFDVHKIWLAKGVDYYAVASTWTAEKILSLGVLRTQVMVSGIPTDVKFSAIVDVSELKRRLGLHENIFTVLIATGSFGIGPIEEIIDALNGFQLIVVCGNNKGLYARLSRNDYQLVKIMGLVDNMHELMAVSDVMVTKPGGLSIAEALVSQLPMIFFNAIPGQEAGNVKVLKTYGIGVSGTTVKRIGEELTKMKFSRDIFLTTLKRTKALAAPSAVRDILALIK